MHNICVGINFPSGKAYVLEHEWTSQDMGFGNLIRGTLTLLLWKGLVVVKAIRFDTMSDGIIGWTLIVVAMLVSGFGNILMVRS